MPTGTNKYYADISSNSCKIDNAPSTSKVFASGTLFDTAAACCTGALGWINSEYCQSRSTGGTGYHNKWYLDAQNMVCKQDCATSGGAWCKPQTDASVSNTLFTSASACCTAKLGWISNDICTSVSTTGASAITTGTDKYYADYSNSPARCAKDCNTANDPTCGGILSNVAGVQMYDTAAACCTGKFGWMNSDLCASLTTGQHTNKWYVNYQTNSCKQDCTVAANSPCGGSPPDLSMQLFTDAATCCSTKLGWAQAATCVSASSSGSTAAATGSLKYYADFKSGTCKRDCPVASTSPECGGVLTNTVGEQSFDTAALCCAAKFGWMDKDLCAALGSGGYSNKFYVDYSSSSCKQDCASASSTNCGGHPSDKSIQMFTTAALCCSNKLSYLNQAACTSKSTTGTTASVTGSGKWYVDWAISKCVKDCPTGSDTECGGLAESWESAEYTSWSTCCSSRLSWIKRELCHK